MIVGRAALHGVVHGRALAEAALRGIRGLELGDVALAAEHRLGIALLLRFGDGAVEVGAHAGVGLEVALDHLLGLAERDAQAL